MRCSAFSLLWYLIQKLSDTREKMIPFLLWCHNPGVIGAGSYPNGQIYSLSAVCVMITAWTNPYIPFSTLTYRNMLICLSVRLYFSMTS